MTFREWLFRPIIRNIKINRRLIMATKQEVLDAIAAEKAEVGAKIEALDLQIQALQEQIAQGTAITAADLDEIQNAVHDIFIPA
jgi:hypothetical protein